MNKLYTITFMVLFWVISTQVQAGVAPSNDECTDPSGPLGVPSLQFGSTTTAAVDDPGIGFCGTSISAPGVWYIVVGTGNTITATTCTNVNNSGSTNYDTKLNVYCEECVDLLCIGGNDDDGGGFREECIVPEAGSQGNRASTVSFCTEDGNTYRILVQGFSGQTGDFGLAISDDGTPCTPVDCEFVAPPTPEPEEPSGPIVIIPTIGQWGMVLAAMILGLYAIRMLRNRKDSEN